jgi:hypothetical protein
MPITRRNVTVSMRCRLNGRRRATFWRALPTPFGAAPIIGYSGGSSQGALAIESIDIPIEERPDLIELLSEGALGELALKPPVRKTNLLSSKGDPAVPWKPQAAEPGAFA